MQRPIPPTEPPIGGKPIALSPATFDRMARSVAFFEQQGRVRTPLAQTYSGGPPIASQVAYTGSGGIAAAPSAGTPATGVVTLCDWNGTSWVAGTDTVTAQNLSPGGAVTASAFVIISWVGGQWIVTLDPC